MWTGGGGRRVATSEEDVHEADDRCDDEGAGEWSQTNYRRSVPDQPTPEARPAPAT